MTFVNESSYLRLQEEEEKDKNNAHKTNKQMH